MFKINRYFNYKDKKVKMVHFNYNSKIKTFDQLLDHHSGKCCFHWYFENYFSSYSDSSFSSMESWLSSQSSFSSSSFSSQVSFNSFSSENSLSSTNSENSNNSMNQEEQKYGLIRQNTIIAQEYLYKTKTVKENIDNTVVNLNNIKNSLSVILGSEE